MTDTAELIARLRAALELLTAEDGRQAKLHDLLETIREQIRLDVSPEHRPVALFTNIQNAVYTMRGRTPLLDDAAIAETLPEAADALSSLVRERDEANSDAAIYAKTLMKFRDTLLLVRDGMEDEGDRVYFGSTNDADDLKAIIEKIDALAWDEIMASSQPPVGLYAIIAEQRARATAAEADAARMREALEQARHELWHLGLVIGQIAKWPRHYFNRVYIEEWVIRTAKIFERWGERERADEILAVTSSHTKTNERLEAARNALGGKDE